jgi:biotin carboxyl carrier protein
MSKTYKVAVNSTFNFEFTNKDIANFDSIKTIGQKAHVLQNHTSFDTEISASNFNSKTYQVKVNNNTYNVNINNDLDVLIQHMGFEIGSAKKTNTIKAPMPGLILDVMVKKGDHVNENDTLLILEAMKMENSISSPREGIIKSININKGDAVDKNHLLIEFE